MRPRLSSEWLHACSGCEMALLNSGEQLLALFGQVDIVHFPLLMDQKYGGQEAGGAGVDLPDAEIGLVSGGVASEEQLLVLQAMRSRCRILVGLGTCATHGGIPAMRNQWPVETTLETVLGTSENGGTEAAAMDAHLDRVYAIDERVRVDLLVPGCPPRPETIVSVIEALVTGQPVALPDKSVCETCPTVRSGKGRRAPLRFLANADYDPAEPLERMRCLFEQGLLCMGPVTVGGCGGQETPLCLRARVPCRGCYGPVRPEGNPLMDMLNALVSNGMDHRALVDRKSLLRFSGAHGLLKPLRPKT